MANGEAIIRQILYGKKYIKEKFGFEPEVFWSPDTFGHPWTIPQILKKSGIDYFYFMRASKKEQDLFWWQGSDGLKVLAFNSKYIGKMNAHDLCELTKYTDKKQKTKTSMYVYGIGDHGGGPTAEDIKVANKLNSRQVFPRLEFSTTHNYFDAISKQKNIDIPTVGDEFNPIMDGCYSTHWDTKVHNRNCERLILQAETTGTVAKLLGNKYPDLEKPWKVTLFNQFHDILPGSAVKPSYDYSNNQAEKAEKMAKDTVSFSIKEISKKIRIKKKGFPVIVFNNLSWERTDMVGIELSSIIPNNPVIKDGDGNVYPVQILNGKLIFIAKAVPSLGYKVFYIFEGKGDDTQILTKPLTLENEFFTLKIDSGTGTISYLYDKKSNKLVIKKRRDEGALSDNSFPIKQEAVESSNDNPITAVTMNNMLQVLYEEPHRMSSWVIGPISKIVNLIKNPEIEIISAGPVAGIVRIKNKFSKSTIIQDIIIYKGVNRIDFNTTINWGEKSDSTIEAPMLKASFTPILANTKATYEIPFGNIERVADGREEILSNVVDEKPHILQ
ncbi:hypothetical protein ES708_08994 [subsurface metagenome]